MNILVSTTINFNPGDCFIRFGVTRLFEQVFPCPHNYVYYNRNPDLRGLSNITSNCLITAPLNEFDLVLGAGTPEWFGDVYRPLYEALEGDFNHVPLIMLGIGSAVGYSELWYSNRRDVMYRNNTYITTRDKYTKQIIDRKDIKVLPCPALFCRELDWTTPIQEKKTLYILQSSKATNHLISSQVQENIEQNLPKDANILCFYKDEFFYYKKKHKNVRYIADPKEALDYIREFPRVVSTRLHGAIAALAMGKEAVLLNTEDNVRVKEAAKVFGKMIPYVNTFEQAQKTKGATFDEIKEFKEKTRKAYLVELEKFK